ncbi:MAG TPA: hypothetical protein VGB06_08910 [Solirubrobacterales bacterium]
MALSLAAHPKSLTLATLTAQIDPDAVGRAVAVLSEVGLLDHGGDSLSPTPAAVHFDQLGL